MRWLRDAGPELGERRDMGQGSQPEIVREGGYVRLLSARVSSQEGKIDER